VLQGWKKLPAIADALGGAAGTARSVSAERATKEKATKKSEAKVVIFIVAT